MVQRVQSYIQTFRQFFSKRTHSVNSFSIPPAPCSQRISIRPHAVLDVVHRRGRSWGLLASYEETRLRPK